MPSFTAIPLKIEDYTLIVIGQWTDQSIVSCRMINKSVIMNCRWIVRPVRPDGELVPSLLGTEVRNMDHVYFEQVCTQNTATTPNAL